MLAYRNVVVTLRQPRGGHFEHVCSRQSALISADDRRRQRTMSSLKKQEEERCIQLILQVERNPCLYDKRARGYLDGHKKEDIWKEIGSKLKMTGEHAQSIETNL